MLREDYERMGKSEPVERGSTLKAIPATTIRIVELPEPVRVGVVLEFMASRQSNAVVMMMDKEMADGVIRDLITARNDLWPTP